MSATALLFVGGPSLLLSGGEDTLVYAWLLPELLDPSLDPSSPAFTRPAPLHAWSDHTLPVTALAAGAGEAAALVASASLDRTVKLRRLADGALLRSVALPAAINDMVLDAGEQVLYAAGADGAVYEVPLLGDSAPGVSGRGSAAAAVGSAGAAAASSHAGGEGFRAFQGHSRPVTCLALATLGHASGGGGARGLSGEVLVSGSQDGTVRVWDVDSGQPVQVLNAPGKAAVSGILVLSRPRHMVAGADRSNPSGALGAEATSGGGGGGRAGPQRMQPLAPLSKYAGTVGSLKRWEGAPTIVDGSVAITALGSSSLLGQGAVDPGTGLFGQGLEQQQLLPGLPPGLGGGRQWLVGGTGTALEGVDLERAWEVSLGTTAVRL
ncbi:hypothetical protein GPECTOR_4g935 [Gonium pectorale]|uniref:Uncharacterized protein n=1 Tax=Gonium pectorale TaxID=33097 RepID=A0A150GYN1_GONPE|nr:hypothetical protein GPECTOR_4g935 [Gonium pectorale]|eukprot:KXZ54863.1 hypothetical protein GPECTOR_4g935 [Gonium pectorale]